MLPICLEEATKVAGDILAGRKCYRFSIGLGTRTATGDAEGAVVESQAVPLLDDAQVRRVLDGFLGSQTQIPPMYSALKQGGQPLYRLARAGQEVERAARAIEISRLLILGRVDATLSLEVVCSKGTYVRTLAEVARALGTCGYVTSLRRVYVEPFVAETMQTLESIAALRADGQWPTLLGADFAVRHLAAVHLDAAGTARLLHGQPVVTGPSLSGRVRLYDDSGRFLGMGEADGRGEVRPRRLFVL
jgi:tRNA pseudouridine55 synthase